MSTHRTHDRKVKFQRAKTPSSKALESRPFASLTRQELDSQSSTFNPTNQRHSNNIPVLNPDPNPSIPIQPKLTIGAVGDNYEQEADRVAKEVVQRLSLGGEERSQSNQPLQRDVEPDEEDELQMKPLLQWQGGGAIAASDDLESAIQHSRGSGQPLDASIQKPMEQAFGGVDFSGVNVHTDAQSDQLNQSIQAKAFTTGQDVFFRQGAYEPGSRKGQELIAHELTHVVQQKEVPAIQCKEIKQSIYPYTTRTLEVYQNREWIFRLEIYRRLGDYFRHFVGEEYEQKKQDPAVQDFYKKYNEKIQKMKEEVDKGGKGDDVTNKIIRDNVAEVQKSLSVLVFHLNQMDDPTGVDQDSTDLLKQLSDQSNPMEENLLKNKIEAINLLKTKSQLLGNATQEIKTSILTPEVINQGQFNFCGLNDFLMAIALRNPVNYAKYIIDLYTAKEAYEKARSQGVQASQQTAKLGNMSVDVDETVTTANAAQFNQAGAATKISQTDWMSMGSIRTQATAKALGSSDVEVLKVVQAFETGGVQAALQLQPSSATLQKAIMVIKKTTVAKSPMQDLAVARKQNKIEDLRKIVEGAMPSEIADWFTAYGARDIIQKADPFAPTQMVKDLREANNALAQGQMVMLNINADTLDPNAYSQIAQFDPKKSHWVLMKNPLTLSNNTWTGDVYSWGNARTIAIANRLISNSFFGYVAATIDTPQSSLPI